MNALKQLRKDRKIVIMRADKGNTTVIMNNSDYEKKVNEHLQCGPYEKIKINKCRATLNKLKAETTKMLQTLKPKLGPSLWFSLYPKSNKPCRFYGLPKIHKTNVPIRPVVDYTNSPTYNLSRYLAKILKPYESTIKHGIKNSNVFKDVISNIHIEEDEIMASFDVCSLFTNVPIKKTLDIICNLLDSDTDLKQRCPLVTSDIIKELDLCLRSTIFSFRGDLYRQTEGVAMGSPVSIIVANLFMHSLETSAISLCSQAPKVWLRYVDDTFVIIKRNHLDELFKLINNFDRKIKFTKELESPENTLPFLDCLVERKVNNSLKISIFRKPTNSGKFLDFKSAHPHSTKVTVVKNMITRAQKLVTEPNDMKTEINLITSTLIKNNYPKDFIKRIIKNERKDDIVNTKRLQKKEWVNTVVIPYRKGISEDIRRILNNQNIRVFFRTNNTLKSKLVRIKDPIHKEEQQNCVYEIKCRDCNATYVGETSRQLNVRVKEHKQCLKHIPKSSDDVRKLENKSAIALHSLESGHTIDFDGTRILQKAFNSYKERQTAEALYIWANPNNINRRDGIQLAVPWQLIINK
ncbi:unnamed protein product [Schistosoma rodhaini]|nr:unnamed protein product [Schistosoma rodhaini]